MEETDIGKRLLAIENELFRYAKFLTHELDRAQDLLQDTNLKILLSYDSFKGEDKFKNWAMAIMHNSFVNSVKREEKITTIENYNSFQNNVMYLPGRNDILSESNDIFYAVENLPAGYAITIKLLIAGHRYDEIAMILKLPLGTVKSRIYTSRAILRKELKDYLE